MADLIESFKPNPIQVFCHLERSDPYVKCGGCFMLCEEHDMGATIPYCGLCNDFWEGVQRCEAPGECREKTGLSEIRQYIMSKKKVEE